jgi:predicted nucleic acid-binding protein
VKKVTVDSSVIISSLLHYEPRHAEALKIWGEVLKGKSVAFLPFSVLVEVVAAIRRRTGSNRLALEVKKELLNSESISFVILDQTSAEQAAEIAAEIGIRGMDAIVVQVAKELGSKLISFDNEMIAKASKILSQL